jgi:hypothetical protein
MKLWAKVFFVVMGLSLFFVSGGVACTYTPTGGVNLILTAILGVLVFVTVGGVACNYSGSRIAKQKESKIAH